MLELRDLELLIRGSVPIIVVETHEEQRVLEALAKAAVGGFYKPLFRWSVTEGLKRLDIDMASSIETVKPVELFVEIKESRKGSIFVLLDFHPFLEEPVHVRLLKDVALMHDRVDHTVVLISHQIAIPDELECYCARLEFSTPDLEGLETIILEEARVWQKENPGSRIRSDKVTLDRMLQNLSGLSADDARQLARKAIRDDGALTEDDLPEVMKAKFELLNEGGTLSFAYDTARFAEVGGLDKLKKWLELRSRTFIEGKSPVPGLDPPKGIMLLGVQGCGKSLAAKAVAGAWGVPLLQLDFGALYDKFHGETERNLRESLKTAEVMSPCVLWVDEIEKALGTDGHDGGTSRRVLGTLLTWLAENKERVFIVATANDIESLPPELLRKGRLDEVFFVDLPDQSTRKLIFEIHLRKRELNPGFMDLDELAQQTDGFSGSEIEQVIVSALYAAYAQHTTAGTAHLLQEISRTKPLSVLMGEKIAALRHWAAERTVPAN